MPNTLLPHEIEAKFYPVEKAEMRSKLISAGAVCGQDEVLMRRVVYGKNKNPQIAGNYVRLRDEGNKVSLSVKQHATATGAVTDQREIAIGVDDFDAARMLLDAAGFIETAYQENYRETWHMDDTEIVIDTWPGIEPYVEIEAPSEEELKRIADLLGFDWDQKIITSNDEIYAKAYSLTKEEALERMQFCTFEKNTFEVVAE